MGGKKNDKDMKKRKIITGTVWCLLVGSICIILFSGFKLREGLRIYQEGDQSYKLIREHFRYQKEPSTGIAAVNFEALKHMNADTAAWLYSPDTAIDYPVMRADDYDWYLHHLPDGTSNANGTLFLDYNCPADFSGRLSIIYGHHMKSGKMFGSLKHYKQQAYYEQHPCLYLYTEQENYRIDLLYGCVIGAGQWRERAFMYEMNLQSLLEYASSNTTFTSSTGYNEDDKFVVLATCSYDFNDARYLLIGVLRTDNF